MLYSMNKVTLSIFLISFVSISYAGEVELLKANEWAVPKRATTLLSMPSISKSMQKLQKSTSSTLQIRYPGGDEGTLWANELRSWLVALGLSSSRIDLVPGRAAPSTIELEVFSNQARNSNTSLTAKQITR